MKKYTALALISTALFATFFTSTELVLAEQNYDEFLSTYDSLLESYTKNTSRNGIKYNGIDYKSWGKDKNHLKAFNLLKSSNIDKVENKKAFWINAYNFLTIELIIREKETESIKNLSTLLLTPWKRFSWELAGKKYTLDKIEHKILRPLGDPAIHFAINCASVSCPDIRSEAFRAETLEVQLKEQVQITLKSQTKGIKLKGKKLYISNLFKWFKQDFKQGDVKAWILENSNINGDFSIDYLDYDWSLNDVDIQN